MKTQVVTLENKKVKEVDLPKHLFGEEVRPDLLNEMVRYQLAKLRAGTHNTKTIHFVSGTGKKPHAQKGTGRARAGSKRRFQDRGGATYGPLPRSYEFDMPKKVRQLALKVALSMKAKDKKLVILDEAKIAQPKTKAFNENMKKLGLESALFVDGTNLDDNFVLASRNLHKVKVLPQQGVNVYDIMKHDHLVITMNAIEQLGERL